MKSKLEIELGGCNSLPFDTLTPSFPKLTTIEHCTLVKPYLINRTKHNSAISEYPAHIEQMWILRCDILLCAIHLLFLIRNLA